MRRFLSRLLDADDRTALADLAMLFVLISSGLLLAALVCGEALHLFRAVAGV